MSFNESYFSSFDNINNNYEVISKYSIPLTSNSENYYSNLIKKFLNNLYSEKEVSVDSIGQILTLINRDFDDFNNYKTNIDSNVINVESNFSKLFIDIILNDRKTMHIEFKNFYNLKHLSNILNTITININNINNENYDLNYAIIFIGCRAFYKKDNFNINNDLHNINSNKSIDNIRCNLSNTTSPIITNKLSNSNPINLKCSTNNYLNNFNQNKQECSDSDSNTISDKTNSINILLKDTIQSKVYLCALLSLNKIYSTKSFWIDLIELKIARKVKDANKKYTNTKKKTDLNLTLSNNSSSYTTNKTSRITSVLNNDYQNNAHITNLKSAYGTNTNINNSIYNQNIKDFSLINSVGSKLKGFFKANKNNIKKDKEFKMLINDMNQTHITRELIKENELLVYDLIKYLEASVVLREYIVYFANFNFNITDAMNVIVEIATKYNFPKERISLYVTLLNTHSFTIKNNLPKFIKENTLIKKINNNVSFSNNDNVYSYSANEKKSFVIFLSSHYIEKHFYIDFITLNKECNFYLCNKFFGNILNNLEPTELDIRLKIWKSLLKVVSNIYYSK